MKDTALFNESHRATYCPEDDKLRLYVGRVPRDEYEALRAEGWQSTAKQDCDFSAVWTVARKNTAESYAGIIEDEDASPQDRAADRAERFTGYLGKRLDEATGHADRYDAGPRAHGFQSYARAVKSADRHDRQATRAVDAWSKAEYWQSRTAGVIANALHRSSPGVRMGRIKTIEAELRKSEKDHAEWCAKYRKAKEVAEDPARHIAHVAARYEDGNELEAARRVADVVLSSYGQEFQHPRDPERKASFYYLMDPAKPDPITLAEACALWLARYKDPEGEGYKAEFADHCRLRIAYEMQMLEAQGGRAALVEMVPGGFIGGHQIHKVNRSNATGRVVSVGVMVKTNGRNRWGREEPGTPEYRMETLNIERLAESSYRAPTPEELEAFHGAKKAAKAAAPKSTAPPLVNPTLEDAQRLQALLNAAYLSEWTRQHGDPARSCYKPKDPGEVCAVPQAVYSANSSGAYAKAETRELCAGGVFASKSWNRKNPAPVACKIRTTGYEPLRVVHITDKPAKPLPASVWVAYVAPVETSQAPATV
jgi:hypothetical protein